MYLHESGAVQSHDGPDGMKQSKKMLSLRMKLFAAFALVALAPLLLLAVINGRNIRQALIQDANRTLFIVAADVATQLDNFIETNQDDLMLESRLPVLQAYYAVPPERRRASQEELRLLAFMIALSGKNNFVRSYGLLDLAGENILDSQADYRGQSEADRDYYRHFQETADNMPFISAVQYRVDGDTPLLYFSVPVLDDRGHRWGYLRVEYDMAVLQSIIAAQNDLAGEGSFGVLFDEYHLQLAHGLTPELNFLPITRLTPETETTLQFAHRLPPLPPDELYQMQQDDLADGLSRAADTPFFEAKNGAVGQSIKQVAVTAVAGQPWLVAFFQPQEVFLTPVATQVRQTVLLVAMIAGTAVLAAYIFGALLVRPIHALTQTVTTFAAGDLLTRSAITTHDEIGVLAAHFNEMAERLGILLTGLESRTEALEEEVAERKKTEDHLRQQRRFLRQVMDVNPSFIFVKDRDGRFVMVNQAFADTYGTSIENMLGKTDADFNPDPVKVEQFRRDDLQVFTSGEELFIPEQRTINAANQERWWQTMKRPIRAEDGVITEVLTIVTEITERKQAEEALRLARDRALEASRVKSEILSKAHHELQTPLGAILGYAEMVEIGYFGEISERQREILQKIISRTNHLTALVQDLLAQANLEARKIAANQTIVLPEELLADMHRTMDAKAAAKGLTLTSELGEEFPGLLISDPKRLQRILSNLVSNGIKFTEQGGVHVRLYQPEAAAWVIEVSDTGPGIPKEAHSYIFEPFRQVDGSITRTHQGFGLGLSLVKELALSLEGDVWLKSEEGKGSIFTVILPYTPVTEVVS